MIAIVDSSVALKWYVEENGSDRAAGLLGRELAAPDIIRVEIANALWKKVRKREIGQGQTEGVLTHLSAAVGCLPSSFLADTALEIAFDLSHPVYDCVYVALARELAVPLITSDKRLWLRVQDSDYEEVVMQLEDWEP